MHDGGHCYLCPVSTVASILLGADGSTSKDGNSRALSTPADRARFLEFRRSADVIVVGGATARAENYSQTPIPVVIVSHQQPDVIGVNPRAIWWNTSPLQAVIKARIEFGERVHIEGGAAFLIPLLEQGCIDQLRVSVSPVTQGSYKVALKDLTSYFFEVVKEQVDETYFYTCSKPTVMQK